MLKKYVISLGGSLIAPDKINVDFLRKFKKLINSHLRNKKFYIVTGGGRTARNYIEAAQKINSVSQQDLDWLGIRATWLNAQLLKTVFGKKAHDQVFYDPTKVFAVKEKICLAAGWKPGWSTDYDAVVIARQLKIPVVINLSNIDYVYDKDPNKYSDAQPIKQITWQKFKKIVGDKWIPGANLSFDSMACKLAKANNIQVVIINGNKLKNLHNYLSEKKYIGTQIS